jgi:hypothetical protein
MESPLAHVKQPVPTIVNDAKAEQHNTINGMIRKHPKLVIAVMIGLIVLAVLLCLYLIELPYNINGKIIRVSRCDNKNYSIQGISIDVYENDIKMILVPTKIIATGESYEIDLQKDTVINKIVINNLLSNPASILGCKITVSNAAGESVVTERFSDQPILPMDRATAISIFEEKNAVASAARQSTGPPLSLEIPAVELKALEARKQVMEVTAKWMQSVAKKSPSPEASHAAALWETAARANSEYIAVNKFYPQGSIYVPEAVAMSSMSYLNAAAADAIAARDNSISLYAHAKKAISAAPVKATTLISENTAAIVFAAIRGNRAREAKEAWELAVTKANIAITKKLAATETEAKTNYGIPVALQSAITEAYNAVKLANAATMLVPDTAPAKFTLTAKKTTFLNPKYYLL